VKITQDEIVERQTTLHIELEDMDVDPYLHRAYQKVVTKVNIPGFRKGKAPQSVIEQFFGKESLINEILDSMLPELTIRAIKEQELDAVGLPSINLKGLDPFEFEALVPLRPEIIINQYDAIRIVKETSKINEEDLQARLEQLQLSIASWEPVERSVEKGDMISAEVLCKTDDKSIVDEKDAVYLVNEEIGRPFPGFSDKLVGFNINDENHFTLDIAKDFTDLELAGKTVTCNVTIKDIKTRVLPVLDDEFAKGIGEGYENLDELKNEINKSLQTEADQQADFDHREKIIGALIECSSIELPPLLIQHEAESITNQYQEMISQAKMNINDYLASIGKTEEELQTEATEEAIGRLQRSFLMSKIAESENIEISDAEIQERLQEVFANSNGEIPESSQNDEMTNYIYRNMLTEKTMERLENIVSGLKDPVNTEIVSTEIKGDEDV
jgi:trigger factor